MSVLLRDDAVAYILSPVRSKSDDFICVFENGPTSLVLT